MWQLLLILYFIFGTASILLKRVLAQSLGDHNRLISSIFFLFFLPPAAIILSFFFPGDLNIGLLNILLLLGGSIIWPIASIIAFRAMKEVDAGIFTIINNLSPIFTLAIALPFLNENLSQLQFLGVGLLVLSGCIAASSQLKKHTRASVNGIFICVLCAAVLGTAITYERFMLNRIDFGAYLIYGWGSQIVWSVILAGRELKKLPKLFNKGANSKHTLILWGSASVLSSVTFISSLKISGSASIISAASDFMSASIVIAAYFFLKERQHMVHKLLATAFGIAGLLLIIK